MSSEDSPTSNDPLFGNAASDLLRGAAGGDAQPPSDPRYWQPPTPEELQSRLEGYVIEAFLARGGMGAVYRGMQASLERAVAIKILPPSLGEHDHSFVLRFKQEARAMAQLNHPGIVKVYDFGEMSDGTLYFVMEFIEGTDVARMIASQGRLHSAHAMAITAHVCDALQYAHQLGIIHRDIKPANIMVGSDGTVKVADFGLAKSFNSGHTTLTMTGHVMGTLNFMAPEALMLGSAVDHRADIYAVGVMLYQMLTGRLPQGLFEMPSLLVPGLDPRYDAIIAYAMRENRDHRYQSIYDMRCALDSILTQPVLQVATLPQVTELQQTTAATASATAPARTSSPPPPRPGQPRSPQGPRPPQGSKAAPVVKKSSGSGVWLVVAIMVLGLGGFAWMQMGKSHTDSPRTNLQKIGDTVIPQLNFYKASLAEACEFVRVKGREISGQHVNIIIGPEFAESRHEITCNFAQVSLADALAYIADICDAEVATAPESFRLRPRSTRSQALDPWAVQSFGEAGKIVIPSVRFQNATIEEAVEFLTLKSRDLDPQKKGLVILLDETAISAAGKVTYDSHNITAANAVAQVAAAAGLEIHRVGDAARLRASAKPKQLATAPSPAPAPATAQPVTPPAGPIKLRPSREDGEPSILRFVNKLSEEVKIQLVDSRGRLIKASNLRAGATSGRHTLIGQVWLITSKSGVQLGLVESRTAKSIITISTAGIEEKVDQTPDRELVTMVQLTGASIGDAVSLLRQRVAAAGLATRIELDPRVDPKAGSIHLDAQTTALEEIIEICAYHAGMRPSKDGVNYRIVPR
ncbi:MAG: protein kinase [Prosthecobacter sp.]|jgi:serine/threonine protein kinase|uniref:serine/threonine-protein kinase n=1 Tax=Prosthecobacter sp. TaxID=1965333 RepID=UPI0019E59C6D|nr:serine/threonine-protein kinase [Prosthecobacter sp.]MBE2284370.1 protein kinase [Prosthecobacter sp.]